MKKIVAIIILSVIGFFLVTGLNDIEGFTPYGEANVSERVSEGYIQKNVTEDADTIVFGETVDAETGSANFITSIIANYRSFDTLGEVTVLFVSALGISLLLGSGTRVFCTVHKPNFILRVGAKVVLPLIVVVGVFVFSHGHLTPGGGFPGGSMIASAVLLMYLSNPELRLNIKRFKATESIAGSIYVIIGLLGLAMGGYFLNNFMGTGTVGSLISAGIVPIVYVLVGLKVGSELTGVITDFMKEEVE